MPKPFYIKGKDEIKDSSAPIISDEFIDKRPEGDYHGQTIGVESDTKLESDLGVGEPFVIRTYEFKANTQIINQHKPSTQDIFNSHLRGIEGFLWQDGLTIAKEIEPHLMFTPTKTSYLITVHARPSVGQTILETPKTLTELLHGSRKNRDTLHGGISVPPTKKKKAGRTAKASQ